MSVITWDDIGERLYETGVDHVVLYLLDNTGAYSHGYAWNGVTSIAESPSGAEPTDLYADNIKYLTLMSAETLSATLEAYTYPDEFEACDGSAALATGVTIGQQARAKFALCYRTRLGNDVDGDSHGYKLHIIYGCQASPSQRTYQTVNDSPEAITFSWEINTTPINVSGFKPTSYLCIDSNDATAANLTALETILYGAENVDARLPLPDEIKTIMTANDGE